MDPDLLPTLVAYYQQVQCTKNIESNLIQQKSAHVLSRTKAELQQSMRDKSDLCAQVEGLRSGLSESRAIADARQREIDAMKARQKDSTKADRVLTEKSKAQAESYKQEIQELLNDLKNRDDELEEMRQNASEADKDFKELRDSTRKKDKDMKELREQLRARESETRKANHWIEKLQADVEQLELDLHECRKTLEATQEALGAVEERYDTLQAQRQLLMSQAAPIVTKKVVQQTKVPVIHKASPPVSPREADAVDDNSDSLNITQSLPDASTPIIAQKKQAAAELISPSTIASPPTTKPVKKSGKPRAATAKPSKTATKSTANKENQGNGARKPRKKKTVNVTDFSASPPHSSPPAASPKRRVVKAPDFAMTPFVEAREDGIVLPVISLSPDDSPAVPRSRKAAVLDAVEVPQIKKKRKLLGGTKTLMDDTPKMVKKGSNVNFGKELSPLKRPSSGTSMILK